MSKVGFVGLGKMGQGMALNLVGAVDRLVVYDLSEAAVGSLVEAGAEPAASIADLAGQVDAVFISLPGPPQVEEVVLGSGGLAEEMRSGSVLFDLSTNSFSLVRRLHEELGRRGIAMLDAPVSGGPAGAASGDLAIWVGGDREVYDSHLEMLRAIGNSPRHTGEIGTGTIVKLSHNLLGAMLMICLAETFSMGVKGGIDPLELWEAMRLGLAGRRSPLDMLNKQVLPGVYEPPAFALKLAHKDIRLATELGRELGVPMRVANLTMEEMTEALAKGLGEQDSRSFMKLQFERAGVDIAVEPERLRRALEALGQGEGLR